MSRSLRELKMCSFVGLALFCAIRAVERSGSLIIEPIDVQKRIFSRVIAYPWDLRHARIIVGKEVETFRDWTFTISRVPAPLNICTADPPEVGGSDDRSCSIHRGDVWLGATWGDGRLLIRESFEPSLEYPTS